MPGLGEVLPNFRQQLARAVGFRNVIIAAGCARLLFFAAERIGGDRDDRDRFQGGIGFDAARGGIVVHDWQLDIHQDEIGPLLRDIGMGPTLGSFFYFVPYGWCIRISPPYAHYRSYGWYRY